MRRCRHLPRKPWIATLQLFAEWTTKRGTEQNVLSQCSTITSAIVSGQGVVEAAAAAKPEESRTRQGAKGEQSAKYFCCLALCFFVTNARFP